VEKFLLYLLAVGGHWLLSFGGIALVGFALYEKYYKKVTPRAWFWGLAVLLFFVATFQAWQDEYQKTHPGLKLQILQIDTGRIPNSDDSTLVIVTASLFNNGVPSVADNWNLYVYFPTPPSTVTGRMIQIPDAPFGGSTATSSRIQWDPADSLYDKAMKGPVESGMKENGILIFNVSARPDDVRTRGIIFTLTCKDVDGNLISGKYIKGSGEAGHVTYPGMKSPALQSPLK
jgi:hypothetical protein